jgi:hypothetical protein
MKKLGKTAAGQLIQVAMGSRTLSAISPAVLTELCQAGLREQYTEPISKEKTTEYQIARNKQALAKLAAWAKIACPRVPFKGKPKYAYSSHPAVAAWNDLQDIIEYKSCPIIRISTAGWAWLKDTAMIEQPKQKDKDKPCAL